MRALVVIFLVGSLVLAAKALGEESRHLLDIPDPDGATIAAFTLGAAEGPQFASLYLHQGDFYARNIQGTGPNLDIGGGCGHDPACRGAVVINHDTGKEFRVDDGYKRPMLIVTARGIQYRTRSGKLKWLR